MKSPHFQVIAFFFCCAMNVGCGSDNSARDAAAAEALESTTTQPAVLDSPAPTAQDAQPKMGGTMHLNIGSHSALKGSEACITVGTKNFKSIVSMQYTLKWDPKVLKFKAVQGFGLPALSAENFGRHILDQGLLTHSWFDASVKGVNKGDGEQLFEICFETIGPKGSRSAVQIVNTPTIIEIANVNSEFLTLEALPGSVLVK